MAASRQSTVRQGHATFVNACENPTPKNLSRQNSPTVVETGALLHPGDDAVELKREATRRTLFQKTSNNVLDIPNGYRKVEVLILRWDESIDEFNKGHNQEVQRLKSIFSTGLGYGVTVASIKNYRNPQIAFNFEILQHVHRHDGEDNLLIVYYTGHGSQFMNGSVLNLKLSATEGAGGSGDVAPVALWGEAEKPLRTLATADVLSILDCCCASTAAVKGRSSEVRAYQLLAASTLEGYTNEPGEKSFTTAFCDSLEELILESKGESFSVIQLWERINTKRASDAALIWDRLKRFTRNIDLYHLSSNTMRHTSFEKQDPERSSLVLRLSLRTPDLDDTNIDTLARQLHVACKTSGISVRQIEWVKMEQPTPGKTFRKVVKTVRRNLRRKSTHGTLEAEQRSIQQEPQYDAFDVLRVPDSSEGVSSFSITVERETCPDTLTKIETHPDPGREHCTTPRNSVFCVLLVWVVILAFAGGRLPQAWSHWNCLQ